MHHDEGFFWVCEHFCMIPQEYIEVFFYLYHPKPEISLGGRLPFF